MTRKPKVLDREDTLAVAIRLMHDGKYRHLPVVNRKREILGLVSVRDIWIAFHYPASNPSGKRVSSRQSF